MDVPILGQERFWYCPNCTAEARTVDDKKPFHECPKLAGLTSPLVEQGLKAKIVTREREDYISSELVQTDANGRPVMSVVVTHDEGEDVAVYAPCATVDTE